MWVHCESSLGSEELEEVEGHPLLLVVQWGSSLGSEVLEEEEGHHPLLLVVQWGSSLGP